MPVKRTKEEVAADTGKAISVRFDAALYRKMHALALANDQSLNALVRTAVREYVRGDRK